MGNNTKEVREAAVAAYIGGEGTQNELAYRFGIHVATLRTWLCKHRDGKSLKTGKAPGRKPFLGKQEIQILLKMVEKRPDITLPQLAIDISTATGIPIKWGTVRIYLQRAGWRKKRPVLVEPDMPLENRVEQRYGYHEMHRDPGDEKRYPSSLTDAEWELVKHIFVRRGPGRPSTYSKRDMLDAVCYCVRSGCSWRMLPKDFPPWSSVYATFRRWVEQGLFELMHDELRGMWREREGRTLEPSAAVIDSQSVKTTEKGGPKATTAARRSRVGSAT